MLYREDIGRAAPIATVGKVPLEKEKYPAAEGREEGRKWSHP